ncbi:sugar O-acetyltransferase, partial [Rhizobium leguminosarum]
MPTEKQKMLAGGLYHAGDPELQADQAAAQRWMARYNDTAARVGLDRAARHRLLAEGLGTVGEGAVVRPPFHCDYGYNIHLGRDVFM